MLPEDLGTYFPLYGHTGHILGSLVRVFGDCGGFGHAFFPLQAHRSHLGLINENVFHFVVSLMRKSH